MVIICVWTQKPSQACQGYKHSAHMGYHRLSKCILLYVSRWKLALVVKNKFKNALAKCYLLCFREENFLNTYINFQVVRGFALLLS